MNSVLFKYKSFPPMGIKNLLIFLQPATNKQHISRFRGKRLAIDALPWLYKGCYSYTFELNQDNPVNDFMYFIFQMLELLRMYDITPVLVFDGRSLPSKSETQERRKKMKMENKAKGEEELKKGNMAEARKYFSRCIIIDQRIIATTMNCLRTKGIDFVVAPYEADSQIGKMVENGEVEAAISEDSDLLLYCNKVILKLELSGKCDYIDLEKIDRQPLKNIEPALYAWLGFDRTKKITACILAGCDYLDNVKQIGIRKSIGLVQKFDGDIDKISQQLRNNKSSKVNTPQNYAQRLKKTVVIFQCAKVFDRLSKTLNYFSPPQQIPFLPSVISQLQSLVGDNYAYSEQVTKGLLIAKTLQPRQVKSIDFKTLFILDKNNIMIEELRYRMKNKDQGLESNFTKEQIEEAKEVERVELEKERQKKEKEEKQRKEKHQKVRNFLNSLIDFADSDEDDEMTQKIQDNQQEKNHQQEDSIDYEKLNPFLKK